MAEATDGGLKFFVRVSMKVIGLEGSESWSSTSMKAAALLAAVAP